MKRSISPEMAVFKNIPTATLVNPGKSIKVKLTTASKKKLLDNSRNETKDINEVIKLNNESKKL